MLRQLEDRIVGEMTDHERSVLRHAAAWFFLVLSGYYILRPIREQISATYGIRNLAWLFKASFVTMLFAIPAYSALVSKFHRRKLVPAIYAFFIVTLVSFWAAMSFVAPQSTLGEWTMPVQQRLADTDWLQWLVRALNDGAGTTIREWVARFLFIWISFYGLFIVSFFWSVVGDMLSTEQGRRIFGFVAGGGTAGGMLASLVATFMTKQIGQANLLLLPAVLLVVALFVYFSLERSWNKLRPTTLHKVTGKATGGNPFAGFTAVVGSKYLFAICIYGLLLATCGTTIYFQQSEIVDQALESREEKTAFFAQVNLWVQVLTLILQTAVVGRVMKNFGLGITLAVLPAAYIVGITSLALAPTLAVLAVISVTGRSAEYAIANPAREVLFTAVKREDRYKAKSFIDTIVRRGGDSTVGSLYGVLRETAGMAMTTLSWCVVPIALCWTALGLFIGRENLRVVAQSAESEQSG